MTRRPELLSSVMLRQNPHNVHEWHKRARLFSGQPHKQILTYTEAVKTVDPEKVTRRRLPGSFSTTSLPDFSSSKQPGDGVGVMAPLEACMRVRVQGYNYAFVLLRQAIGKPHTLWCAFAKFYDRHGDLANARIIFEKATEVL